MIDGVDEHLLDGVVIEAVRGLHLDRLFDAGAILAGMDGQQAVGIDAERHLQTRHAGGHRRDALQREARQAPAVGRELALALDDVDLEAGLLVLLRRVLRARGRGRGRVARKDAIDDTAADLDAERQRRHVEEEHVVGIAVAGEEVGLERGAERDDLVRVDVRKRLLAEHLRDVRAHRGDARRAADQDDAVEDLGLRPGVAKGALARHARALEQRLHELVEASAGDDERGRCLAERVLDLDLERIG